MIAASGLKSGMAVRYDGHLYRVIGTDYRGGQGKMGGVMHARLQDLRTGKQWEPSFRSDLMLEDAPVEKRRVEYLYSEAEQLWFMDLETYEQFSAPRELIGQAAAFLDTAEEYTIETVDGSPVGIDLPDYAEAVVEETAPPTRQPDSTWKTARLTNGLELLVPPFIRSGDAIRVSMAEFKYMDRAKASKP